MINEETRALGRLTLARDSERDIKIRGLQVYLDEAFWVDLHYPNTVDRDVEPGKHTLRVTNSLYSSRSEFVVAAGENYRFTCGNFMRGLGTLMFLVTGFGPYRTFLTADGSSID